MNSDTNEKGISDVISNVRVTADLGILLRKESDDGTNVKPKLP